MLHQKFECGKKLIKETALYLTLAFLMTSLRVNIEATTLKTPSKPERIVQPNNGDKKVIVVENQSWGGGLT